MAAGVACRWVGLVDFASTHEKARAPATRATVSPHPSKKKEKDKKSVCKAVAAVARCLVRAFRVLPPSPPAGQGCCWLRFWRAPVPARRRRRCSLIRQRKERPFQRGFFLSLGGVCATLFPASLPSSVCWRPRGRLSGVGDRRDRQGRLPARPPAAILAAATLPEAIVQV